jgi:hypothetical protein
LGIEEDSGGRRRGAASELGVSLREAMAGRLKRGEVIDFILVLVELMKSEK